MTQQNALKRIASRVAFEARRTSVTLVRGIFHPLTLAAAASLFILRFTPTPSSTDSSTADVAAAGLLLLGLITLAVLVVGAFQRDEPWVWDNEKLTDRRRNFANLLNLTQDSLVILTGCLHHGLYADPEVVDALRRMPGSVRISVFHESEFDSASSAFREELERRRSRFVRIQKDVIPHRAVFDGKHARIEALGVDDGEENKHVDYFVFDPQRARLLLAEIEAAPRWSATGEPPAQAA